MAYSMGAIRNSNDWGMSEIRTCMIRAARRCYMCVCVCVYVCVCVCVQIALLETERPMVPKVKQTTQTEMLVD